MATNIPVCVHSLTLTGETGLGGKYLIRLDDAVVCLTNVQIVALCDLIVARLTTATGRSRLPSVGDDRGLLYVTVHRLRRAIDAVLGEGTGGNLIRSAARGEYFLALPAASVTVRPEVKELAPNHLDSQLVAALLA